MNHFYVESHHPGWVLGSTAKLRCMPGYYNVNYGRNGSTFTTQILTCQPDSAQWESWSGCRWVHCISLRELAGALLVNVTTTDNFPEVQMAPGTLATYQCPGPGVHPFLDQNMYFAMSDGSTNVKEATLECKEDIGGYWRPTVKGHLTPGYAWNLTCIDNNVYCSSPPQVSQL